MWRKGSSALFLVLMAAAVLLLAQEAPPPAEPQPTAEDLARKNPVKSGKESIDTGKRLFDSQCTMCHGEKGDGKGDLAVDRGWKVTDFTDAKVMKGRTDGELFFSMTKGKGHMPGQEGRLKGEQKWHIVNFIRSLAAPTNEKPGEKHPAQSRE